MRRLPSVVYIKTVAFDKSGSMTFGIDNWIF